MTFRDRRNVLAVLACCVPWVCPVLGCKSNAAHRRNLASRNPIERSKAVVQLAEAGDAGAVHKLVDLLEDPDRAVRMYSIVALTRLCGNDYGYKYYEPDAARVAAVRRWRDALREGRVVIRTSASGSVRPVGPSAAGANGEDERNTRAP